MGYQFNPLTGNLDLVGGGGGGGNPFDQSLNTTDNVTFKNVAVNDMDYGGTYISFVQDPSQEDQVWQHGINGYDVGANVYFIGNVANQAVLQLTATGGLSINGAFTCVGNILTSGTISGSNIGTAASLNGTNVVQLTSTQTLTNKTLTTPTVNNPNVGNGTTFAKLTADSADILAVANSTTACSFKVYNTKTDLSNYEAGIFDWKINANALTIGTAKAGTGTARRVRLDSAENIDFYVNAGTRVFQCASNGLTAFSTFGWQINTAAADPTTSSTPFSNGTNYAAIYKNTTTNVVSLWVRDGTTMKKVALA